ncbi:B-type flagellar hook-associated protein 2 [Thalassocella blandensis]|nr:B-type flagellar hook-associated protein 2 [Thalassocella blandensis]
MAAIDNNIIQSLGAGSGIDTSGIVKQLVEIERAAPQQRIDDRKELTETQISDFGLLKSSLATLQSAVSTLSEKEGLYSKTASFTDSDALVPKELGTDVLPGTYNFVVNEVAQSQTLSSPTFSSILDPVGEGELTIRFGSWNDGATAFTEDLDSTAQTITIDSSNNTLKGLRDAINAGDFGVQASIVNDGSTFRLLLTAESGEQNQLEITVAESSGTPTNDDADGLSRFAFNDDDIPADGADTEHTQQMTQYQAGRDASFTINGLPINRSSNTVDDVVDGLTVELLQASPGETVTVTVSDDKTFAEQNVRDFVEAYNNFLDEVDSVFKYNEETEKEGSLKNDSLAKSVLSRMRTIIGSAIPGLSEGNYTALTNVGIRTNLDGSLTIKEEEFRNAFNDNFEDVQKLFGSHTSSTVSDINVNSFGSQTVPGSYDVVITTKPQKGYYAAQPLDAGVTFPFDTTGKTYTLELTVNGEVSGVITIPTDTTYNTEEEFAAAMQSVINSDSNLKAKGVSVTVNYDTDHFEILSSKYGANSVVSVSGASADSIVDLGMTIANGTNGVDVAGLVNGVAGFGLGNVLLPKLGQDAEGLTMLVGENATSGTVSFSRGFSGELDTLIDDFLKSSGLLSQREQVLEARLETFDEDQEALDRRISAYEERLIRQFIAMENILSGLNSSGSFLENLIDTLPFTAGND